MRTSKTTKKPTKPKPTAETLEPAAIEAALATRLREQAANARGEYRTYSNEEKIQALEAVNLSQGNVHAVAYRLGIPQRTLHEWTKGNGVTSQIFSDFEAKKGAG